MAFIDLGDQFIALMHLAKNEKAKKELADKGMAIN
jgi:hypothetical protein